MSETNVLTVEGAVDEPDVALDQQRAHWLAQDLIAWSADVDDGLTLTLHHSRDASLGVEDGAIVGSDGDLPLAVDPDGLPADLLDHGWRHLAGYAALRLPEGVDREEVATILEGQIAVSATDADGDLVAATGVQIPGVLDDLYADAAEAIDLGVTWDGAVPTLRVWAPTAQQVKLLVFDGPRTPEAHSSVDLSRDAASGVWEAAGEPGWDRDYYLYEVTVFAPEAQAIVTNLVTDPYSLSLARDSERSQIVDLADEDLAPSGWSELDKPDLPSHDEVTVYELHLRDFSVHDPLVPEEHRGTYRAFTHADSHGMRHLRALADAGLSHLHLLPTNDIGTIPEDPDDRVEEDIERPDDPASEEPQARMAEIRDRTAFNWGYDPYHFTAPQGSYSTDPDGVTRVVEFREMVQAVNQIGLRFVKDVVYNHTDAAGQADRSVLDRVVPGYYQRLDERGDVETSTCCPNTATEHRMMERLMIDSVVTWARDHKVDGFRFDLMGHHSKPNMLAVRDALDALTLADDGVDGTEVVLYGEGWNFGEVANDRQFEQATQLNMAGTGIGTFNDRMRDAARGGHPAGDPREQGFLTGLYTNPADHEDRSEDEQRSELLLLTDRIRVGLAGNLADYVFENAAGEAVTGADIPYNGSPTGYTAMPRENVVYVSKHDNETLFDAISLKAPLDATLDDRLRMQNLGLSLVGLSQGTPFFHAGSDMLRSKSLDRNSYNSGEYFNRLDFTYTDNNWGVGLPSEAYNGQHWDILRPILRGIPRAGEEHIAPNVAHLREVLEIRSSSPLFRLSNLEEVQDRLTFLNTGPEQEPGVVAMRLTAPHGEPATGGFRDGVVVFNASWEDQVLHLGVPGQRWRLHPVLRTSVDPTVRESELVDGKAHVPALTTAVFIHRGPIDRPPEDPPGPSGG